MMHPGKINREILEFFALISIQIGGTDSLKEQRGGTMGGQNAGIDLEWRDD